MKIHFVTPTQIALSDITSMGDSVKRGNDNLIGAFDSGLKYSIALFLRNGVNISIRVPGEAIFHDNYNETTTDTYTFDTFINDDGKQKELIQVNIHNTPHGGAPMSQHDMREPSGDTTYIVKTGFAKALGHQWELWMGLRELWSNMLDEQGVISFDELDYDFQGTITTLDFDEDSEFAQIWNNRHLYINEKKPLFQISSRVDVLENPENYLRIYKQNILVYEDTQKPSRFAYDIKFGTIDERRILSNLYSVENEIVEAMRTTTNEAFLKEIISNNFELQPNEFLAGQSTYYTASDASHDIAAEVYEKYGDVKSYEWLINAIKKRKDCRMGGKIIQSVSDSLYSYSSNVTVDSMPVSFSEPDIIVEDEVYISSFSAEIKKHYNFNLDVEVKTAKLKGSKVIADKHEKCLIVDENFDIGVDFPEFIVQYIDLTVKGNVIKNMSEYICNLLKK